VASSDATPLSFRYNRARPGDFAGERPAFPEQEMADTAYANDSP